MAVVVTELPYQVNKTTLIEKMAELVGAKKITDVSDIRDESDRDGMRIVVEVKRDGSPHTVMQQLFKHTALQTSFSANMLALVDGQPQTLGLKRMLEHYIAYRQDVVRRRTEFELARAQERAHILEGPEDRARQPRRGDRDHPRRRGRRRRRTNAHEAASS